MKKRLGIFVLAAASMMLFAGCQKQYEVANYQGELKEGQTKSDYDKELFYRNDKKTSGADPFILDNTAVDGYYYQYVTEGSLFCYRSQNMMDWEPVGNTLDNLDLQRTARKLSSAELPIANCGHQRLFTMRKQKPIICTSVRLLQRTQM